MTWGWVGGGWSDSGKTEHTTVLFAPPMSTFRITWFDGELVEIRRAEGLRQLAEELLDEWVDDPELCPLEVVRWLAVQGISWSAPAEAHADAVRGRTAAAHAARMAFMESDTVVRLFFIACGACLCVEPIS